MIRLAFLGCGEAQQTHYKCLIGHEDIEVAGHFDAEPRKAQAAAKRFGGEAYSDFGQMLDKAKPTALYVAIPPFARGDAEVAAAERGIHLYLDHPIALDRPTARRIASAVRTNKVICSVGYPFRYLDTVQHARKLLKGQPVSLATALCSCSLPETWWWRRMDKSGGQLTVHSTKAIDLLRYLCGDVAELYGTSSTGCMTQVKDFDIHDSSVLSLRMKSGATASISSSCISSHNGQISLDIITPEAAYTFRDGSLSIRENGKTTHYVPTVEPYAEANSAFIDAVRTGKKSKVRSSISDAMKSFLVSWAGNESIKSGLPVRL